MIAIRKDGRIVSRSKNLRGVLRYGRNKMPLGPLRVAAKAVTRVHVLGTIDGGALLRVRWSDGAYAVAKFACVTVARRWVQARRSWPCARFTPVHVWHVDLRGDA
jgi:hypothetical protein